MNTALSLIPLRDATDDDDETTDPMMAFPVQAPRGLGRSPRGSPSEVVVRLSEGEHAALLGLITGLASAGHAEWRNLLERLRRPG